MAFAANQPALLQLSCTLQCLSLAGPLHGGAARRLLVVQLKWASAGCEVGSTPGAAMPAALRGCSSGALVQPAGKLQQHGFLMLGATAAVEIGRDASGNWTGRLSTAGSGVPAAQPATARPSGQRLKATAKLVLENSRNSAQPAASSDGSCGGWPALCCLQELASGVAVQPQFMSSLGCCREGRRGCSQPIAATASPNLPPGRPPARRQHTTPPSSPPCTCARLTLLELWEVRPSTY